MADRNERMMRESLAREEARLAEIEIERTRVEQRIGELKAQLASALHQAGSVREPVRKAAVTNRSIPSTSKEKTTLFLDLFRGRAGVYPKRWVNTKKGTKGYSPACANEWVRDVTVLGQLTLEQLPFRVPALPEPAHAPGSRGRLGSWRPSRCLCLATRWCREALQGRGSEPPEQALAKLRGILRRAEESTCPESSVLRRAE